MTTFFISDLHLCPQRPDITSWFQTFLKDQAQYAEALYILGDLFEYWLGDDAVDELAQTVADSLQSIQQKGTSIYFIAGNRDFLLGSEYAKQSAMIVISEPIVIDLYGQPTLLVHGDAQCTDDKSYQQVRTMVRTPTWQAQFLSKTISERSAFANQARMESQKHTENAQIEIMDVNDKTIEKLMKKHQVKQMIHGHTHRPCIHEINGTRRFVLGDWHKQTSYLSVEDNTYQLICT